MSRIGWIAIVAVTLVVTATSQATLGGSRSSLEAISHAITELDVESARKMLAGIDSDAPAVAAQRARLAIHLGDCDSASAILGSLSDDPELASLVRLSKACARATAGSLVIERKEAGLWLRLQDDADRALVPYLERVAVRARSVIERDLGVEMPRPLRIDLVRDLFTLSAISGLPLEAAETTGTVAVARWGRVTMLSPRGAEHGFPWEDTLAHGITHLALSRATRDHAPLWLQEGLAKREETRWRSKRLFDGLPDADGVARDALASGESVGVDGLGSSIAMLPSPRAASIAFAEVSSFIGYWIDQNGMAALHLLLRDLKGLGRKRASDALASVSGYGLDDWVVRWQAHLLEVPASEASPDGPRVPDDPQLLARVHRLGQLLFAAGAYDSSGMQFRKALAVDSKSSLARWRAGRAMAARGQTEEAHDLLGGPSEIAGPHAGWFALRGRFMKSSGDRKGAEEAFRLAVALDPLLEEAACEGIFTLPSRRDHAGPLPNGPDARALCEAARKIPRE